MAGLVIAIILIAAGVFFLTVSVMGLLRFPDFYARTHAVGKSETLGAILVLGGLAVYNGLQLSTVKIVFILLFALIANPTAVSFLVGVGWSFHAHFYHRAHLAGRSGPAGSGSFCLPKTN